MALAHRGGSYLAENVGRENTLHSFDSAVALGYRYLEIDVHVTLDGIPVVFHDLSLQRMAGVNRLIADLTHDELREFRISGRDVVPDLADVFERYPHARFNIDIKADAAVLPLARAIRRHNMEDRVCVGSFSAFRISWFRRVVGPAVPTSCGPIGVAWYAFGSALRPLRSSVGVALQIPRRTWGDRLRVLDPSLISAAHASGRVVHVWTVDAPEDMHHLIDLNVDGIVTDRPDLLKQVLIERDLWEG